MGRFSSRRESSTLVSVLLPGGSDWVQAAGAGSITLNAAEPSVVLCSDAGRCFEQASCAPIFPRSMTHAAIASGENIIIGSTRSAAAASGVPFSFPHHLLDIASLQRSDLLTIFECALMMRETMLRPNHWSTMLAGRVVVNLFAENSTRTRSSFELAERRLGMTVVNFSAEGSSFAKGESLRDTVRNLEAMRINAIVLRHSSGGAAQFVASHCNVVVVNAGDGRHEHPTQGLLDTFTLYERWRHDAGPGGTGFEGRRVTIVGDILHGRVALSNIHALRLLGAEVAVCAPPTLLPRGIETLVDRVFIHLAEAVEWSDALNMLRVQHERMDRAFFPNVREYTRLFGLNHARLGTMQSPPLVLHPGPINRGVELDSATADGPCSLILPQVENGVAVRMAVLALLLGEGT